MKIRTDAHKIIVTDTLYADRALYASIPGARRAKHEMAWYMPRSPVTAMNLRRVTKELDCSPFTDEGYYELLDDMRRIIDEQKYKDDDLNGHAKRISTHHWNTDTPPWGHQVTAGLFSDEKEASYLAMEMGTGKTLVIINEILSLILEGKKEFLIICPKSVIDVWVDEFSKHWHDVARVAEIIALKKGTTKIKAQVLRDHDMYSDMPRVVVVNYESVWRNSLGDYILSQSWDMVVADEAHKIKSAGGKASRFCARLAKKARRRRCLSGTPLPNNQLDAYGQWRFLDPGVFGTSFTRFRARYARMGGFQGYEIVAWHNQEEFRRLLDYLTFRVDKDVLDLPPATTTVRRCTIPPSTRRLYRQIEEEFIAEVGGNVISMTNVLKRFTKLQQLSSGFLINDDGNTISLHHEKSKLLTEFLESIDKDEHVVVFCRFRRDLEEVRDVSVALGRSHGELSGRANDLEGGMLPASVNVLAVQVQAGGVGVNLTRARYCAFYSVGYSLADFLQAQARVHRGGQDHPVTYVHLIADDTMDDRVYQALAAKKEVIDEILAYIKREKR